MATSIADNLQILHILTASPAHAQLVLRAALQSGFRESGAVSLTVPSADEHPTPVVAVRSMGLGFESLIGSQIDHSESQQPRRQLLVSQAYLRTVMAVATERFAENAKRIARFQEALATLLAGPPGTPVGDGPVWEDAAARRERKRAEGLRRRAQLQKQQEAGDMDEEQAIEVANALSGL